MLIRRLVTRGYRNLADLDREAPANGLVLLGANAQGKTNLLEAIYYPVLFRSFRGASDGQVLRDPPGFAVERSSSLGMLVIRSLTRQLRGRISTEPRPHGTRFTVSMTMPGAPAAKPVERQALVA